MIPLLEEIVMCSMMNSAERPPHEVRGQAVVIHGQTLQSGIDQFGSAKPPPAHFVSFLFRSQPDRPHLVKIT